MIRRVDAILLLYSPAYSEWAGQGQQKPPLVGRRVRERVEWDRPSPGRSRRALPISVRAVLDSGSGDTVIGHLDGMPPLISYSGGVC